MAPHATDGDPMKSSTLYTICEQMDMLGHVYAGRQLSLRASRHTQAIEASDAHDQHAKANSNRARTVQVAGGRTVVVSAIQHQRPKVLHGLGRGRQRRLDGQTEALGRQPAVSEVKNTQRLVAVRRAQCPNLAPMTLASQPHPPLKTCPSDKNSTLA